MMLTQTVIPIQTTYYNTFETFYFNPNKAGLFEGSSFSWGEGGCQFNPPSYFKKNLSNINITLYDC